MTNGFHAGGAYHVVDSWTHGVAVMRDVWHRWADLDITQIGSLIAIAGTVPTAWRFLHGVWAEAAACVRRFFLASVTIPAGDALNRSVVKWIAEKKPRHYREFTGRTEIQGGTADRAAALKRHGVQYCPHWHSRWLWHEGRVLIVQRAVDSFTARLGDPTYDGMGGEDLTISCLGWSAAPVQRFIGTCRAHADQQTQFFVLIYTRDRYGVGWQAKTRRPVRQLSTVHIDTALKAALVGDVRTFLDARTQQRYQNRSMPYRRGYLFYGPPGTGKSSLSVAIASEFALDLYQVQMASVASDADLEQMFHEMPPRCVVLLEDIDAVWVERDAPDAPRCTMSGLLNVLDGVGSPEGRIVIMTTNHPNHLDPALIRPGRVDMRLLLGNISQASAADMFVRMFTPDVPPDDLPELQKLAAEFAAKIPEDTFTPSLLQGFFQQHLESPRQAVASIEAWVKKEENVGADKEFEMVNGRKV